MKIPVQLKDIPGPARPKWWQSLQQIYQQTAKVINGNINLAPPEGINTSNNLAYPLDNISGISYVYVTGTPGTDDVITHNLGRIPYGYHVVGKTNTVDVYNSPTANTTTKLYLRSTVAGVTVKVMVY